MLFCFTTISSVFGSSNEIKVNVDGQPLEFDVAPKIFDNRTFVPVRAIFEKLNFIVEWDSDKQEIQAKKDKVLVTMKIGSKIAYYNGQPISLDVHPRIIDGRTLVPLRFVGESANHDVLWDENTKTVFIESKCEEYAICEQKVYSYITATEDSILLSKYNGGTYKINTNCSQVVKLLDTYTNSMQVIDNCLYGRINGDLKFYKMDLSTNKLENIIDSEVCNCFVLDGWIYYSNLYERPWSLYKIKLDGSEQTKLLEASISEYCIIGDYIYYSSILTGNLVKMSLVNAEDSEVICDGYVTSLCLYKNEVYFSYAEYVSENQPLNYKGIFKYIPTDKTVKQLCDKKAEQLNVINDCIYYISPKTSKNDITSVFRMKIDGSYNIKLLEEPIITIEVVGNYIYYYPSAKDYEEYSKEVYRIYTDGGISERLTRILDNAENDITNNMENYDIMVSGI